jgi:MFS family permease
MKGDVGRDLAAWAWRLDVSGDVGRDLMGRFSSATVAGSVGNDVDVAVSSLTVSGTVGGDLFYRSNRTADLDEADVAGQVIDIPARAPFMVTAVLRVAALFGLFGYMVGGIVLLWLFDATGARAVDVVGTRAWLCIGLGLGVLVGLILIAALLAVTLVGIPLALTALLALVVAVGFGSVPAVAAAGTQVVGGRGGVFGGLVLGAVALALVAALVPTLAALAAVAAVVWGLGGWVLGGWQVRGDRASVAAGSEAPPG